MRKPVFSVILVLLLLAGLVVATGAAGDEPEEVPIYTWTHGATYTIGPGQVGVLWFGWAACNPGLVGVFINASNFEVSIDGEVILTPEDVDELWPEPYIYETPPDWAENCMGKGRPAMAGWEYALDALGPGEYQLRTRMWLDHTLVDGADSDGDGKIDKYTPDDYMDSWNTIIVEE